MNKSPHDVIESYFKGLGYESSYNTETSDTFIHTNGQEIIVRWGLIDSKLPSEEWNESQKYLLVLMEDDLETIGIEELEAYSEALPDHVAITIFQEDYIEHIMKDIWFFLNR